ncbi:DUF4259 domain-containing protein [Vibrio sp. WXL103]|uniref:DUF4259 domain-containing protein n=1 Tax=Vibrio sp. WXL103 TaxID=3450710 RepID=UPI003EC4B811
MKITFTIIILILISPQAFSGAWGAGSFENDTAWDWVYEVENTKGANIILDTIGAVFITDYKDVDVCTKAIAAIEVVASLKDGVTTNLPEALSSWVALNKTSYAPEMAKFSLKAINSCKNLTNSELAQLWHEGNPSEWLSELGKLEFRLSNKPITKPSI